MREPSVTEDKFLFILEKQSNSLEVSKVQNGNSRDYILQGIAANFGEENNNGRIYEEGEYLPHLEYLREKMGKNRLVGELDHPEKFDISLKNISHVIEELAYDEGGRVLRIKVKLLDTPAGLIAKSLVDAGIPLSISSRAAGNVGPDKKVQIKKIFTYDLVADPGFPNAQLERVYESAGFNSFMIDERNKNSVVNSLQCINESFGIKNESGTKIYSVENNDEFQKSLMQEKNKSDIMESNTNNEYVTAGELDKYSIFIKKKIDELESQVNLMKEDNSAKISESSNPVEDSEVKKALEERVMKLEKYTEYLAENLESAIKYGEYLGENLDNSISYAKYLAENLDKNISYAKYLAENVDKNISYTEYIAENVDKNISYSKYLAEKVDDGIQYSEYVAENLNRGISYTEYLGENLDKGIAYAEYLGENLDKGIAYTEYLGEKLDQGLDYSEYLAENVNKGLSYSEYIAEGLNKGIAYSDYIAEKLNSEISWRTENLSEGSKNEKAPSLNESARENAESASKVELTESGFAGDYTNLSVKIDSLIESVKTQKTEVNINEARTKVQPPAQTQKAEQVLNESNGEKLDNVSGYNFIDKMPEDYAPVWESLNESQKQSVIAQATFYNLETEYQIKNFWTTRQLGTKPIGLQKLNEGQKTPEPIKAEDTQKGYSNDYLQWVAKSLEGKL